MTVQRGSRSRAIWSKQDGNALMCTRVAVSQVQISGIRKQSMLEVASTA
jgi:hypothetical protein